MNKTINLLKLLPVVLLSACTTSYPPQDTTSAPELPHRNVLVQQPDNCSVGCPQRGSQQTIYRHVFVKLFIEYYAAEIRPEPGSMGCTGKPGARTCQTG